MDGSLAANRAEFMKLPTHLQEEFALMPFSDFSAIRATLRMLTSESRIMARLDAIVGGNMPRIP